MVTIARCGCLNGCSCQLLAGPGILITGEGSSSDPYVVSSSGSAFTEYISLGIFATDANTSEDLVAFTDGYTFTVPLESSQGAETLNKNLLTLAPETVFQFTILPGIILQDYSLTAQIWVSSSNCTNSLYARRTFDITSANSFAPLVLSPTPSWTVTQAGTDLVFVVAGDDIATVGSTAGGCYMAQIAISWVATP